MPDDQPKLTAPQPCGHCANIAPMRIVGHYSNTTTRRDNIGMEWDESDVYELLLCPACSKVSIRTHFWNDGYMESKADVTFETLYPSSARTPVGLPGAIAKAYEAALRVKGIDPNAFGVLIGRVIEMVCVDRGAVGRFLGQKLADLADKREIPEKLVAVAHGLAKLRNVGAHAELGDLTPEEIPIMENLCCALLDYVYTAPSLAQKAADALAKVAQRRTPRQS